MSLYPNASYLEIGVYSGSTFFQVTAARKVAVDPGFQPDVDTSGSTDGAVTFHEVTSDEYFGTIVDPDETFDVIFLDGLHTFEQTLRDFANAIAHLAEGGVIVIDDILPRTYQSSLSTMEIAFEIGDHLGDPDRAWMGDVYRLAFFIDSFFQQFTFRTVSDNEGQLIVWRQRRSSVEDRTVESVSRLPFDGLIRQLTTLNRRPFAAIRDEVNVMKTAHVQAQLAKPTSIADV